MVQLGISWIQVLRGWIFSVPELLERCRTLRKYLIQEEDWQETGGNKAHQIMSNQETATPNLYYFKQVQSRKGVTLKHEKQSTSGVFLLA